MTEINKVAVIGSGVMGANIAAHIANSGTEVLLLDIIPDGAEDRSGLAKGAIAKMLKADPAPLTHKRKAKLITAGNLEDDLKKLGDCDWIIEVIIERLDIKQSLYKKIDSVRKKGSVVSSNTSTLPLHVLTADMPDSFKNDFIITHFFNPPRYMKLLELVPGEARADAVKNIRDFCDIKLGKGVVECHDTPGFIANRIGVYWLASALHHALEMKVPVEVADSVMSRPVGIPKTGVFGLMDLIGIDLLPLIAKSFADTLDGSDEFFKVYKEHEIITGMIEDGYTGRKGKGGFYRLNRENGGKVKEAKNLQTGEYATADKPRLACVTAAKKDLRKLVEHEELGGKYAKAVLLDVLSYAASLVPEIADTITDVDEAMRLGYNWKFGPFELIDKLGAEWLKAELESAGRAVPALLQSVGADKFYGEEDNRPTFFTTNGSREIIKFDESAWTLADKKAGKKPIAKNPSVALWDVGDGIVCLEFTSKMNSLDPMSLEMIQKSVDIVKDGYKGMIIANDADNFCVGANIGVLLFAANVAAWKEINGIIKQGQDAYMGLKYAPFPVVAAPSGFAFGGGCEILLHSDAVQAHIETYTGLVEVGVGIVPGWGGCKEMIMRQFNNEARKRLSVAQKGGMFALSFKEAIENKQPASLLHPFKVTSMMSAIQPAFMNIAMAKVAKSAEEAKDMLILNDKSGITMNRKRLLADAKARCLGLVDGYKPPETFSIHLPGQTARTALDMALAGEEKKGNTTPHDMTVSRAVGHILSGGETDITQEVTEQDLLDLELQMFMELVKHPLTLDRIENMLNTGKPLRN